jgi:hypothetical protein
VESLPSQLRSSLLQLTHICSLQQRKLHLSFMWLPHCGRVSPNVVLGGPHRGPTSGTIQQFPNVFHNGFATLGYPQCGPHWGHAQCGPRMWSILVCFHTTSPLCPILVFLPYRFPNVAHIGVSYANLSRLFFVSPLNPLGLMHELS